MKTVVIFDQPDKPIRFFVVGEDWSHINGVYINASFRGYYSKDKILAHDYLSEYLYDKNGKEKVEFVDKFPVQAVKDGAKVIVCGFIP